ncbi:MAG: hypothetical protein IJE18_01760 [Bacteroidaceae bacterium]|nr:hypothetical protein [Bacteroidaceae bacterium]MBQ2978820.1 hypothetical protein [Bacteroidaceae bacterium]
MKARYLIILFAFLIPHVHGKAQSLFSSGAHIEEEAPCNFALGEYATEYTSPAALGFIPAMIYTSISSEMQLTDTLSIQVHFDNKLQTATIYMSQKLANDNPRYIICATNGIIAIQGNIETIPYTITYDQLKAGIYIMYIWGIEGRIPYVTRWIKK